MLTLSTTNIFYGVITLISLSILVLLIKLLSSKSSTREKKLLQELESIKSKNVKLEDSLLSLQKEMKKLDATTKTSFISDQLHKMEMMEDKVLKYKKRVEEVKNIAQEAMNVKYEFLSNIRHEIRTPMNSILTFADMLVHELQNVTHLSYANNILTSGRKLLVLMDDIIELSRLETGAFDINRGAVDSRLLFNTIVQEFQKKANAKGLELTLDIDDSIPDSIMVDDKKIKDILSNLIDNAIKFTSDGYVEVKVMIDKYDTTKNLVDISMSVKDSGMGIDASNYQKIFEIFEKRENANDIEFQGTGLGLSIHRKMARMMDGDIVVDSKLGKGSIFVFSLRNIEIILSSAMDGFDESSIDFSVIRPDGATIMVIDEHSESREVFQSAFSESAVEVEEFDHPREAIERLKNKKFDMIFIDINVLSIDDNAVSKFIAKMSQAPVVSLTSVSLNSIEFIEGGANIIGHLKKPISKLELFKVVLKNLNSDHLILKEKEKVIEADIFVDVEKKDLDAFVKMHKKVIPEIYKTAELTNDLGAIKHFAEELFKLSYQYNITTLSEFATKLLSKIELFDIDTINSMMLEYKAILKRIQNL